MENLIPVLNKLQDVFATVGTHAIDLPQIVVVGCQSAGKSSVLETIVRKDFLPRGAGICTRRPLILQMIHIEAGRKPEEWAEFLHDPGNKYTDFDKVRQEIEDETDRMCGTNKGVTDAPISLKVYSPNVLNLTMVDLPGLTKIAVEDQPADIAEQIDNMVNAYIKQENAIILAVTPANQDLANSDSLIAARKVDPEGLRTIGVLTKLDLMDKGTDARDVLLNKVYPLRLGYIGIVNRSQADISGKKDVKAAIAAEKKFFVTNDAYRDIAATCGSDYLAFRLNGLLMEHIKRKLPALYRQIQELHAQKKQELKKYGSAIGNTLEEQQLFLFKLVDLYMREFESVLNGTSQHLSKTDLDGGATIISALIDEFPANMLSIPSVKELPKEKVIIMMEGHAGLQRSLFFPEESFHTLVRMEVDKLRPCVLECIERAKQILTDMHLDIDVPELERFTALKETIQNIATEVILDESNEAKTFANRMLDIQMSFINSHHPDFVGKSGTADISAVAGNNVDLLIDLVHRYYVIVRKEVIDSVPKAIYRCLFKESVEQLRMQLVEKVVLCPDFHEDPVIMEKRRSCLKMISALEKASEHLSQVRKAHL